MQTSRTFSIHYWLNLAKIKGDKAPVYVRLTIDKKRLEISLKRWTEVTNWDTTVKRSKGKSPQSKALNLYLDQVHSELLDCYKEIKREKEIVTAQAIKSRFLGEDQQYKTLLQLVEYHQESMSSVLKWGTLKNYYGTEKYLKRFLKEKIKREDISLQSISYTFITDFDHYLRTSTPIKKGQSLNNNGIMKHLERLKKLLNFAVKLEWVEKDPFRQFSLRFKKQDRQFLNLPELKQFEELKLTQENLRITRDLFVFACYTGLSYSDLKNLQEQNVVRGIDGEYWIFSKRVKNEQPLKIPLLKKALEILDNYNDKVNMKDHLLLPVYSNQKVNLYLKQITYLLKLNKKLSFHSARHTFATTVTLANGVPLETVSKLLGHTKLSTTQIYARVLEKKVSEDMTHLRNKLNIIDLNESKNVKGNYLIK